LALLDLIEEYEEDWEIIGKKMNRSPVECLQQFIKMPLNENVLERINMHSNCLAGEKEKHIEFEPSIFGDVSHPILT